MTRVKICGITNIEDARWAAKCGADAIGFVFAESGRRIAPEAAGEIMREMGPFLTGVGVFVDAPVEEVRRALHVSGCTVAQLHGDETQEQIEALAPYPVVKAIRVRGEAAPHVLAQYRAARAILLDTYAEGRMGGTGQRFDLSIASELVSGGWRVIVAGGLTPENVGEVISAVRPYGVDVSTGVEAAPGRKDPDKVARFIAAVRACAERSRRPADAGRY
jgi:phosphoribosylanthranilate isomerase